MGFFDNKRYMQYFSAFSGKTMQFTFAVKLKGLCCSLSCKDFSCYVFNMALTNSTKIDVTGITDRCSNLACMYFLRCKRFKDPFCLLGRSVLGGFNITPFLAARIVCKCLAGR